MNVTPPSLDANIAQRSRVSLTSSRLRFGSDFAADRANREAAGEAEENLRWKKRDDKEE